MGRSLLNAGLCLVVVSLTALPGCEFKSGPESQEATRSNNHVARGHQDTPLPIPTVTGSPQPEPPVSPDDGCMVVNPKDGLDFGRVAVGEVVELSVAVSNTCGYDVMIVSVALGSLSGASFAVTGRVSAPIPLSNAGRSSITVRFEPTEADAMEGELLITTISSAFAEGVIRLPLRGDGVAP